MHDLRVHHMHDGFADVDLPALNTIGLLAVRAFG